MHALIEYSLVNSIALSIPKTGSSSSKCKKRRLDALPKAQSVLRATASSSQEKKVCNFNQMLTLPPCPPPIQLQCSHHIPQTLPNLSPSLINPVPSDIQNPPHQTAHDGMYKINAVREVRPKNLLPVHHNSE